MQPMTQDRRAMPSHGPDERCPCPTENPLENARKECKWRGEGNTSSRHAKYRTNNFDTRDRYHLATSRSSAFTDGTVGVAAPRAVGPEQASGTCGRLYGGTIASAVGSESAGGSLPGGVAGNGTTGISWCPSA